MKVLSITFICLVSMFSGYASAEWVIADNAKITFVAVNGGADSSNPGTSCFKVNVALSASCTGGYIAIPNNNKELLSAIFQAKITQSLVRLDYSVSSGGQHCAHYSFTDCTISSIALK